MKAPLFYRKRAAAKMNQQFSIWRTIFRFAVVVATSVAFLPDNND